MKPKVKPRLRGVSHEWGAYIAGLAGLVLVVLAPTARAAWAAGIYSLSLVALLGISALYHRPTWKPDARAIMRRLDHSAIFILVAGTYTPLCMLVLVDRNGGSLLGLVWAGAGLGVAQSIFWPKAPKPLVALVCVALGWVAVWEWTPLTTLLSLQVLLFIGMGGILYTLGAIVYSARRPDPWPEVFGYHEIFHALVVAATVLHFTAVAQIVFEFGGAALASPARGQSVSALDAAAVGQRPGGSVSDQALSGPSLRRVGSTTCTGAPSAGQPNALRASRRNAATLRTTASFGVLTSSHRDVALPLGYGAVVRSISSWAAWEAPPPFSNRA